MLAPNCAKIDDISSDVVPVQIEDWHDIILVYLEAVFNLRIHF